MRRRGTCVHIIIMCTSKTERFMFSTLNIIVYVKRNAQTNYSYESYATRAVTLSNTNAYYIKNLVGVKCKVKKQKQIDRWTLSIHRRSVNNPLYH